MRRLHAILAVLALCLAAEASAQYYSWGDSPASVRWRQIKTESVRMIYPEDGSRQAEKMLFFLDTLRSSIGYGYRHGPMHTPVVMHTRNMRSNALVMWAPKRMDIIAAPSIDTYSEPWLKQLASHEYRHNVQYNNINRGLIRILGYVLGQQAPLIGLVQIPIWYIEGDAVMAETQMSSFGRALQPSFTLRYRAMDGIPERRWQIDRWFCGSFKHEIPDHYQLGYQIVRYSQCLYGMEMWDDVIRYSARNPYMINPKAVRLRRHYGTSTGKLMRETFDRLYAMWDSLPANENSATIIAAPEKSYTEYSHPVPIGGDSIAVMLEDMDRTNRIAVVDAANGSRTVLAHTGLVSTRPILYKRTLYWTEYRGSTLWEQKVLSNLCSLNLDTHRKRTIRSNDNLLYPTATDDGLFCVDYRPDGTYGIKRPAEKQRIIQMPDSVSLHGLAWDDITRRLYFIALSDGGMWLGQADADTGLWRPVTEPRHITLSSLRAGGGRLYFGSIASGLDEAHMLDIASGRQFRITESEYGSFSPAPLADGKKAAITTYTKDGYMLAVQNIDSLYRVPEGNLPVNRVNAPLPEWDVPNIDTIRTPRAAEHESRRFAKAPRLFNLHSWMPFAFDPYTIVPETDGCFAGATVMSQDLLSSCSGFLSYGYSTDRGSRLRWRIEYSGLGPEIGVSGQWGGSTAPFYEIDTVAALPAHKHYLDLSAYVSVPMLLSSGHHIRRLTPSVDYTYINGYTLRGGRYARGVHRLTASLQFSDYVRQAARDFLPRWGYVLRVSVSASPTDRDFRTLGSIFAAGYLPGIAAHHSITIRANCQKEWGEGKYGFRRKELFPRGVVYDFSADRYAAASLDYQLPLCYPDWGIPSVVFIKRIRLNLWGDYAYADLRHAGRSQYSYGGDAIFDICPFRLPSQATTSVKITVAKPSDRAGVTVYGGIQLSL